MLKSFFSKILRSWYLKNKRDLPWRVTNDPYVIWLSEVILQQTRVAQGLQYFLAFSQKYPTVQKLADASEQEILKLWQGLGYYSRARNLHLAAKMVVSNFNGVFPKNYNNLIQLKGVGVYTASAIASFANNERVAVVDGNVYRVLSRIFGVFTPINTSKGQKEFKLLADSLLSSEDSATHNQAIMEFGALCCTPKKPNCIFCPFQHDCFAFQNNAIFELPVKTKKTTIKKRYFNYIVVTLPNNTILLNKRTEKGIWQQLYEFPLLESENEFSKKEILDKTNSLFEINLTEDQLILVEQLKKPHKLSHQHIYTRFFNIKLNNLNLKETPFAIVPIKELEKYPVPVLISNFFKAHIF